MKIMKPDVWNLPYYVSILFAVPVLATGMLMDSPDQNGQLVVSHNKHMIIFVGLVMYTMALGLCAGIGIFGWRRERDLLRQFLEKFADSAFGDDNLVTDELSRRAISVQEVSLRNIEFLRKGLDGVGSSVDLYDDEAIIQEGQETTDKLGNAFKKAQRHWYDAYDLAKVVQGLSIVAHHALGPRDWKAYIRQK